MLAIFTKELSSYFTSLIAYVVIGLFVLFLGLMVWVFPDTSVLDSPYASLESLFSLAPLVFLFLIPAITMRSFAEEKFTGTIEFLQTQPVRDTDIVVGKFLAAYFLVIFALLPAFLYYYTVHSLGAPVGNIDSGSFVGSFLGLLMLAAVFVSIGIFASSLSDNQIVAFLIAAFLCFFMFWGFHYISQLPIFYGKVDDIVQMLGIDFHYQSISRGLIDSRDVLYFLSVCVFFFLLTKFFLGSRNW